MSKKKILFCLQTMVLGGVEKELITILKRMPPEQYDITVLLLYISDEEIVKQIPEYVRVINLNIDRNYYCSGVVSLCMERMKKGKFIEAGTIALKRVFHKELAHTSTDISAIPNCKEDYDIAICYHIHSPLVVRYVAEKTNATKKIAWIHNDFSTTRFPVRRLEKWLNNYQEIIAVSRQVEKEYLQLCPKDRYKVYMCHNVLDETEILTKANESIEENYLECGSPKLLTIGRITRQKGFDLAIQSAAILKKENCDFKWFFIGWGNEEECRKLIVKNNVADKVYLLGRKDNPYPYIKHCDIYIQPSRHEAYCTTVNEAKVLKKPIICYNFAGAEEQIKNEKSGLIVPVGDINKMADAIRLLLQNPHICTTYSEMLQFEQEDSVDWNGIKSHFDSF